MRKPMLAALALSLLSACASLSSQVFHEIHEGDGKDKVVALFGEPDHFAPIASVPGANVWIYKRRHDVCGIVIKDDKVTMSQCQNNPNYVNPAAAFFKGFSDGYNANRSVSCTTNQYGTTAYTNCQ